MELKFGLIVVSPETAERKSGTLADVYHFVGYEYEPTQTDIDALHAELLTDPEFGLGDIEFVVIPAPSPVFEYYRKAIEKM